MRAIVFEGVWEVRENLDFGVISIAQIWFIGNEHIFGEAGTYHHALIAADFLALIVHRFDRVIPLRHALSIAGVIESGDGDFAGNDRVDGCSAVANHEQEFGLQNNKT